MAYTLACRDTGTDCPYTAQGETMEELLADVVKHAREAHGMTEEQLSDPQLMQKYMAAIKPV